MRPIGRRGGTANDADACESCARAGCDPGCTFAPGCGVAIETGGTGCTGGEAGGTEGGAYDIGLAGTAGTCGDGCGYGASSKILCVGATRCADASFAPQPPQNRESGSFSVPHVGQRIPPSA
jgi:hypothetical protein